MYTDEELIALEEEEHTLTLEAIMVMLLALGVTHNELEKELRAFYQKYGTDGIVTYQEARRWVSDKDHRSRIVLLLLFINSKFNDLLGEIKAPFNSSLRSVIAKESEFFGVDLDAEDLLYDKWGADEAMWLERLEDDVELWYHNISKDIKQRLLKRDSIDDVLDDLDKRFTSIEKVLKRLALTESTAMGSIARRKIFKELGIKKYRFYAREDERTCEHCGALHGLVFPMTAYEVGVTASPIHAHCRCWEIPIVD